MQVIQTASRDTTSQCEACGDYPVPHLLTYLDKTFNAWQHDRAQSRADTSLLARISRAMRASAVIMGPHFVHAIYLIGGSKTFNKPPQATTGRALAIWQEARARGIPMQQLTLFGSPVDSYRAKIAGRWIYFESLPIPPRLEACSYEWADDKYLFKRFLAHYGIPAAKGAMATNLIDALSLLEGLSVPVVVKPRLGSNSRHTTPLVQTPVEFQEAFELSQELCRYVLFEEHLYGYLCRATLVDGRLVGFLESRQPTLSGDGLRSIRELVASKNADKPERVSDIVLTDENVAHIRRQGYEVDSVLGQGQTIQASRLPGRGSGGENREMLSSVHPKLRAWVERTAQLLQAPIVGFDLIIADPEADPDLQKWGILEANTVPFIEIHSDPLYGEPSNVAASLWDLWQKKSSR